jgi:hypothetical protein
MVSTQMYRRSSLLNKNSTQYNSNRFPCFLILQFSQKKELNFGEVFLGKKSNISGVYQPYSSEYTNNVLSHMTFIYNKKYIQCKWLYFCYTSFFLVFMRKNPECAKTTRLFVISNYLNNKSV